MILLNLNNKDLKTSRNTTGNAKLGLVLKIAFVAAIAAVVGSFPLWATATQERQPDSVRFPIHEETRDEDDILDEYPSYLKFVLHIGKSVNRRSAERLANKYTALRKYSPKGAARFLRGLRFEMTQKLQYAHMSPQSVNSSNQKIRSWVGRHLDRWYHEADEHLFRSVVHKKMGTKWY